MVMLKKKGNRNLKDHSHWIFLCFTNKKWAYCYPVIDLALECQPPNDQPSAFPTLLENWVLGFFQHQLLEWCFNCFPLGLEKKQGSLLYFTTLPNLKLCLNTLHILLTIELIIGNSSPKMQESETNTAVGDENQVFTHLHCSCPLLEVSSQIFLKRKDIWLIQPGRILKSIWTLWPPAIFHSLHSE